MYKAAHTGASEARETENAKACGVLHTRRKTGAHTHRFLLVELVHGGDVVAQSRHDLHGDLPVLGLLGDVLREGGRRRVRVSHTV